MKDEAGAIKKQIEQVFAQGGNGVSLFSYSNLLHSDARLRLREFRDLMLVAVKHAE